MARFRAHVTLNFDAPSVNDAGARLQELASAASSVGFELERGQVDELPADAEEPRGWRAYAPLDEE
jgi:hypothetical protein